MRSRLAGVCTRLSPCGSVADRGETSRLRTFVTEGNWRSFHPAGAILMLVLQKVVNWDMVCTTVSTGKSGSIRREPRYRAS